jgi:hypothetical protein
VASIRTQLIRLTHEPLAPSSPLWIPGQPDNSGNEYAVFWTDTEDLNDGGAGVDHQFVCECDGKVGDRTFAL